MGLATNPADIDLSSAAKQARVQYDDAAGVRIRKLATEIRHELAMMQNKGRARHCRTMAVANLCSVLAEDSFEDGLIVLLPESLR